MTDLTLGIFSSSTDVEYAIQDLRDAGFDPKDISIMMRDREGEDEVIDMSINDNTGGGVSGAATGSILGGLAGLLIGIGAITIPGIGALLIGGPIATTLGLTGVAASTVSGAVTGAAGGLVGALMNLGLSEEDARVYERHINEGGILVAFPSTHERVEEARTILEENDADQVRVVRLDASSRLHRAYHG